jgi:hypothetical protein
LYCRCVAGDRAPVCGTRVHRPRRVLVLAMVLVLVLVLGGRR